MPSLVSIIIPTFNRANLIGETLDSVLSQTYTNWECIVVDDGSTDNTSEVLKIYCKNDERFRYYHRPNSKPKGANSCRNYGVEKCKAEYLIFLDSDDRLLNFCLQNRLKMISKFPNNYFWIFPMLIGLENGESVTKEITYKQNYLIEFLSYRLQWGIMCALWNKDFFIKIKGFDEFLPRLNDPEIHIRAMVLSETKFKVFNNSRPDTIYLPNIINDESKFSIKFFQSLQIFIPSVSKLLIENKKETNLKFLKNYFFDYIYTSSQYMSLNENLKLLKTFKNFNIVSNYEYINLIFLITLNIIIKKIKKKKDKNFKKILNI